MTTLTPEQRDSIREDVQFARRWTGTSDADVICDYYPTMDRVFDAVPALLDALTQSERDAQKWKSAFGKATRGRREAEATIQRLRKWAQEASDFYEPAGDTVLALLDGDA